MSESQRDAADASAISFENNVASWAARDFERWLTEGLLTFYNSPPTGGRSTAFWPLVVNVREPIVPQLAGAVHRVPLKQRVFSEGIFEALAHWIVDYGTPVLRGLLSLARMKTPNGLVPVLRKLLATRPFGDDPDVLYDIVEVACAYSLVPEIDQLLDEIRRDSRTWRSEFAGPWLRAKVRAGKMNWIEGLELLRDDFQILAIQGFSMARFLDRLLDEVQGLEAVALSIEQYFDGDPADRSTGEARRRPPWFFDSLFGGKSAPLGLGIIAGENSQMLVRNRPYRPKEILPIPDLVVGEIGARKKLDRSGMWRWLMGSPSGVPTMIEFFDETPVEETEEPEDRAAFRQEIDASLMPFLRGPRQ